MDTTPVRPTVFDAAQYFIEPPDLFVANVPSALRDRVPRVVELAGGGEAWSFEDGAWLRPIGFEVQAGRGPIDLRESPLGYRDLRPGLSDSNARLTDMDTDEIDAAAIFPTFAQELRFLGDADVQVACVRVYNDAAADWMQRGRGRIVAAALVPTTGLDAAVAELQRARGWAFGASSSRDGPPPATSHSPPKIASGQSARKRDLPYTSSPADHSRPTASRPLRVTSAPTAGRGPSTCRSRSCGRSKPRRRT